MVKHTWEISWCKHFICTFDRDSYAIYPDIKNSQSLGEMEAYNTTLEVFQRYCHS